MIRLGDDEIEKLSQMMEQSQAWPVAERDAFFDRLQVPCEIVMPLGELLNPKIAGAVWAWAIKNCLKTGPITEKYSFDAQGIEGCFSVEEMLSFAIRLWEAMQPSYRINILIQKGALHGIYKPTNSEE